MGAHGTIRAARLAPTGLSPTVEPASGLDGSATSIPAAQDANLSAIMRREGIREVRLDPLTDLFSVRIADWITGFGDTVGEALDDARRRTEFRRRA